MINNNRDKKRDNNNNNIKEEKNLNNVKISRDSLDANCQIRRISTFIFHLLSLIIWKLGDRYSFICKETINGSSLMATGVSNWQLSMHVSRHTTSKKLLISGWFKDLTTKRMLQRCQINGIRITARVRRKLSSIFHQKCGGKFSPKSLQWPSHFNLFVL